jgi:hypothetical protein
MNYKDLYDFQIFYMNIYDYKDLYDIHNILYELQRFIRLSNIYIIYIIFYMYIYDYKDLYDLQRII